MQMMEDGYARYVGPLVVQLESIEGHEKRVAELKERVERQLNGKVNPKQGSRSN
jgi:hypothetical protein